MSWMLLIILLAVGVCFWILGWQIWKKEKITLLHDYHYAKVKPEDRKAYTGVMGKGLCLMGVGMIAAGVVQLTQWEAVSWYLLGAAFAVGLAVMIYAQMKYNHGIF